MKTKRFFVSGAGAIALSLLWIACSSSSSDSCPVGAEACPCTAGNGCDPGLTCLSTRCVRLGTGGAAGSGGSAGANRDASAVDGTGTAGKAGSAAGSDGSGATGTAGGAGGSAGSAGTGGASGGGRPGNDASASDAARDAPSEAAGKAGAGGAGGASGAGGSAGSGGTAGAAGTAGSGGTGGSGSPDGGAVDGKLGSACASTSSCAAGLTCIRPIDNLGTMAGGVGNGICTVECTSAPCASGICLDVGDGVVPKAYCFEPCNIGPNLPAPPVSKCHGRRDVACEPVDNAETIFTCIPLCVTDADCGTRKCDMASGFCVDTPKPGKRIGSSCTVVRGQQNDECAGGLCLPIEAAAPDSGTAAGICSALCRLGTDNACGYRSTPLDAGPAVGSCVLPWGNAGYNSGDLGLCLQLCDAPADCSYSAPNWTCRTDFTIVDVAHSVCLTPPPG